MARLYMQAAFIGFMTAFLIIQIAAHARGDVVRFRAFDGNLWVCYEKENSQDCTGLVPVF